MAAAEAREDRGIAAKAPMVTKPAAPKPAVRTAVANGGFARLCTGKASAGLIARETDRATGETDRGASQRDCPAKEIHSATGKRGRAQEAREVAENALTGRAETGALPGANAASAEGEEAVPRAKAAGMDAKRAMAPPKAEADVAFTEGAARVLPASASFLSATRTWEKASSSGF